MNCPDCRFPMNRVPEKFGFKCLKCGKELSDVEILKPRDKE